MERRFGKKKDLEMNIKKSKVMHVVRKWVPENYPWWWTIGSSQAVYMGVTFNRDGKIYKEIIKSCEESKFNILYNRKHTYKERRVIGKKAKLQTCIPTNNNVWSRKLDYGWQTRKYNDISRDQVLMRIIDLTKFRSKPPNAFAGGLAMEIIGTC